MIIKSIFTISVLFSLMFLDTGVLAEKKELFNQKSSSGMLENENEKEQKSTVVNGLQINLMADKTAVTTGGEIHFKITFMNRGERMFRIFDPHGFWSHDFIIRDDAGNEIPWRSGYVFFSPKVNVYPGTTRCIPPGGCFEKTLRVWIDNSYALVFGETQRSAPLDAAARTRLGVPPNIPDDFIGTGRIFELKKPGTYKVSLNYEKTEIDGRVWHMDPDPAKNTEMLRDVWTGTVGSNSVTIEIR